MIKQTILHFIPFIIQQKHDKLLYKLLLYLLTCLENISNHTVVYQQYIFLQ